MKISDRVKRLFTKSEPEKPEKKDESYFDLTKNIVNARDSRWWNWASIPLDKIHCWDWEEIETHILKEKNIQKETLMLYLGVSERTIRRWKSGESSPSKQTNRLLDLLYVDFVYIS